MQFRFSQDNLVFASTFAVYSHNYNHAGTQLFVSLSLWHVFINDLFCKKLSRSAKFQHAVNQVAQIYFSASH